MRRLLIALCAALFLIMPIAQAAALPIETMTKWVGKEPVSLGITNAPAGDPGEGYRYEDVTEEQLTGYVQNFMDTGVEIYLVGRDDIELYACKFSGTEFFLLIEDGNIDGTYNMTVLYSVGMFDELQGMAAMAKAMMDAQSEPTETPAADYLATIEMQDGAKMQIELYSTFAPETVDNFVKLIQAKFYDGLTFHRIIADFLIQGGDPEGTGMGDPGYGIKGEFAINGFEQNTLKHTRGVLSMARSDDPNSAGSQFFVVAGNATSLDGSYAAFGKLVGDESYATLDAIIKTATDANDAPTTPQVMKAVTVRTP